MTLISPDRVPLRIRYQQARFLVLAWIGEHRRARPTKAQLEVRDRRRRAVASVVCELGGLALTSFGLYTLAPWLGLLAGGVALLLVGRILEPPKADRA